MHNTAGFGRFIGWVSIVAGSGVLAIGLFVASPDAAREEFDRCEAARRVGIRHAPCPPPAAADKPLLISAGAGGIASGVFFLLLAGILTTLLEMRVEIAEARREAERRRHG